MTPTVVICAYTLERWDALKEAVDSCRRQTLPCGEIILVIDYNEELEDRSRSEFPDVRVLANHLTKGLSGARNTGVLASTGDVIVFLDDDAYAEETWLEHLTRPFDDPKVAGTGGWIVPLWEGPEPHWFPRTFYWVLGCSYDGLPPTGSTIRNPIGASMAMRRSVFAEVGGFTDGIGRVGKVPLGCEETELCIRYGQRHPDERIVLVREAIVHHRVPPSRCTWKYFSSRCWAEGVSKAAVSSLVGSGDGLKAERAHVARALPREVAEALFKAREGHTSEFNRAFHTVAGALWAGAGLVRGTFEFRRHPLSPALAMPLTSDGAPATTSTPSAKWRPLEMLQIDVEEEVSDVTLTEGTEAAWVEAVRQGDVLGRQVIAAPGGVIVASRVSEFVEDYRDARLEPLAEFPDDQLPLLSVIVPTICSEPEELVLAVERLTELDYPDFEIIVVDNRTGDDLAPLPDFPGGERVRTVREPVPGVASARNCGVALSNAPFVVFTDDDVLVEQRWLRVLVSRFLTEPDVAAIGGLILPAVVDTEPQLWFEEFFGGFSQSYKPISSNLRHHDDDSMFPFAPGRYAAGANMAFRRDALDRIGGFPRDLGTGTPALGGEDISVFLELASSGSTVAFEPRAIVRHLHRRQEDEFRSQVFGYGVGLTAMYMRFVLHHPGQIIRMLAMVRLGFRQLKESRTMRAPTDAPSFPPSFKWVEIAGWLYGPVAYFRSRRRFSRM